MSTAYTPPGVSPSFLLLASPLQKPFEKAADVSRPFLSARNRIFIIGDFYKGLASSCAKAGMDEQTGTDSSATQTLAHAEIRQICAPRRPAKKSFYFIIEGVRKRALRRRVCWLSARCFSVWSRTLGVSAHNASVLDASRHDASLLDVSPIGVSALDVSRPSTQGRRRRAHQGPTRNVGPSLFLADATFLRHSRRRHPATSPVGRWPGVAR